MTTATILVVDDHRELAENIAEILESAGHRTQIAVSAEEAAAIRSEILRRRAPPPALDPLLANKA